MLATSRIAAMTIAVLGVLGCAVLSCAGAEGAGAVAESAPHPPGSRTQPRWLQDPLEILGASKIARLEQGVWVPLRDGTKLMATSVVPNGASAGSPRPAILDQSPYPAQAELRTGRAVFSRLIRKGYEDADGLHDRTGSGTTLRSELARVPGLSDLQLARSDTGELIGRGASTLVRLLAV
jgi:hypothetical protein